MMFLYFYDINYKVSFFINNCSYLNVLSFLIPVKMFVILLTFLKHQLLGVFFVTTKFLT